MANIWARKPMNMLLAEAGETGERSLKRTLGPFQLTALGVGAVIGAGIFVLSGLGAHYAGPGLMLSFVLSGTGCAFAALCYAEFAAMIPSGRQRLHLRLRHPGRTVCLDHRLGPDPGIRHGRQHRVFGLVEPLHRAAGYFPYQDAALAGLRPLDRTARRRKYCGPADGAGFGLLSSSRHSGLPQQSVGYHRGAVPATPGECATSCWTPPQYSESRWAGTCRPS